MINENNNAFFFYSFITGFANHVTRELVILTISYPFYWGFPGVSDCKEPAFKFRKPGFDPWVRKIFLGLGRGAWHGYSPWGLKELDTTE